MNGLEKNTKKLFSNEGKLFLAAFDHPQIYGSMEGLTDTVGLMRILKENLDGTILNPGMFSHVSTDEFYDKKLIMRSTLGGSMLGEGGLAACHNVFVSPETAISYGADAVLVMLILGGKSDVDSATEIAKACDRFHQYSVPVIVEVLSGDYEKNNDHEFVKAGARIAAELGADVVKAFYCSDFAEVVKECPVPIILAGGTKGEDITDIAKEVVEAGVSGFAFGRNIFQADKPEIVVEELSKILHNK